MSNKCTGPVFFLLPDKKYAKYTGQVFPTLSSIIYIYICLIGVMWQPPRRDLLEVL